MSDATSIPYKLRPNKSVDRELFLSLLGRLGATLKIEKYQYIGLGGPFLEDFRLIHARTGISDMVCVEMDEGVHLRQLFNKPIATIDCEHSTLEEYLDGTEFEAPIVLWLDYTDPRAIQEQIEFFSHQISSVPIMSVVRLTLNANPGSLGCPPVEKVTIKLDEGEEAVEPAAEVAAEGTTKEDGGGQVTIQEWRLERCRERLASFFPVTLTPADMTHKKYGCALLETVRLAAGKVMTDLPDRKIVWALATHYSDGQPMVTTTAVIVPQDDDIISQIVTNWQFCSEPRNPLAIDLPALSTMERLRMESSEDPRSELNYNLPESDMGVDPFDAFNRFYRVFPHFARVDL